MATIKKKFIGEQQFGGMVTHGNLTTFRAVLQTGADGKVLSADQAVALAIGDKVYLEKLPEGMFLEDAQAIVSTAMTANVTGSLGFEYVDGVDNAAVPQDAAYFGAALNLAAAARLRANGAKPLVKLPKAAYLVLTIAGAANAKASRIDFTVQGERMGPR